MAPLVTFIHEGSAIDHTPGADVSAGDVVVAGELVGVARHDIKANELGALHVMGVYEFPKTVGVGEGIAVGSIVYWDAGSSVATTNAAAGANKKIGTSIWGTGTDDNDTLVTVRMSQ